MVRDTERGTGSYRKSLNQAVILKMSVQHTGLSIGRSSTSLRSAWANCHLFSMSLVSDVLRSVIFVSAIFQFLLQIVGDLGSLLQFYLANDGSSQWMDGVNGLAHFCGPSMIK